MSFIDSHCHIDFACFDRDREQVINRCHGLGINTLVAPGTRASQWQHQLLCAEAFPQIKVAFGLHPYFLAEYQPRHMNLLSELLQVHRKRVVAVGEMGLDKHIDISWSLQMQVFEQQLEMA